MFQSFQGAINHPRSAGSTPVHWREVFDEGAHQPVQRTLVRQDTERGPHGSLVLVNTLHHQLVHGSTH